MLTTPTHHHRLPAQCTLSARDPRRCSGRHTNRALQGGVHPGGNRCCFAKAAEINAAWIRWPHSKEESAGAGAWRHDAELGEQLRRVAGHIELAGKAGYSTTGGDNQGGYSPIANVPKTVVSQLLEYLAQRDNIKSLKKILEIPPSAELAPGQQDETDLMPYVVLDDLLYLYARKRLSLANCWRMVPRFPNTDPNNCANGRWTCAPFLRQPVETRSASRRQGK